MRRWLNHPSFRVAVTAGFGAGNCHRVGGEAAPSDHTKTLQWQSSAGLMLEWKRNPQTNDNLPPINSRPPRTGVAPRTKLPGVWLLAWQVSRQRCVLANRVELGHHLPKERKKRGKDP